MARICPVLLLLLTVSCQGFVASQLPLDLEFVTDASIAGTPLRVMLDTGCTDCLLDQQFLTSAGLNFPKTRNATALDSQGIERTVDVLMVSGLRIGDVDYGPFESAAQALPNSFRDQHCLLGMGALNKFAWCFDAPRGQVLLIWPEHVEPLLSDRGYRVIERLPLGDDKKRPHVTVRLNGEVDCVLLLDTGAYRTHLPSDIAAKLALPPSGELGQRVAVEVQRSLRELSPLDNESAGMKVEVPVEPVDVFSVGVHGVVSREPLVQLRTLAVGGRQLKDVLVTAGKSSGLLGGDVLSRFPWLLHGSRQELWLLERTR